MCVGFWASGPGQVLRTFDPEKVYVIGGIVDRNRLKGRTCLCQSLSCSMLESPRPRRESGGEGTREIERVRETERERETGPCIYPSANTFFVSVCVAFSASPCLFPLELLKEMIFVSAKGMKRRC